LKEDVDCCFLAFDLATNIINIYQKADVGLDEFEFATRVKLLALIHDAIRSLLRLTNDVDSGFRGIFGKLQQRVFANTTGSSHEDGYEAMGEGRSDAFVRRNYFREENHLI